MKRMTFATATAVVALATAGVATGVHAADLIVDEPAAAVVAPADHNIYALLYGGVALGGVINWYDDAGDFYEDYDYTPGWALGGAIGIGTGIAGLSVEADVFHTHREYDGSGTYPVDTTSLMANLKYTLSLNDVFDVYAGAGVGGIHLNYVNGDPADVYSGWGLGYQVMVGASANVADNVAIFGELRYQNTFSPVTVDIDSDYYSLEVPTTAVLVGIKLSM